MKPDQKRKLFTWAQPVASRRGEKARKENAVMEQSGEKWTENDKFTGDSPFQNGIELI